MMALLNMAFQLVLVTLGPFVVNARQLASFDGSPEVTHGEIEVRYGTY